MYELDKKRHCVFSLQYHLVVVVKYRQKVFTNDDIVISIKEILNKISKDFDVNILECECGEDHIHILFKAKPTLNVTKFINIIKGHSSRDIRKKYKNILKNKLWGDHFWSPSYFLSTVGNVNIDVLKQYVENQRTFQE